VWLGVGTVTHPMVPHAHLEQQPDLSWAQQAIRGVGISGLNPKVFLLFPGHGHPSGRRQPKPASRTKGSDHSDPIAVDRFHCERREESVDGGSRARKVHVSVDDGGYRLSR
jgi:hypothetical protein